MQHIGAVFGTILADIFRAQPVGQVGVHLKGATLPFAPDGVGQLEIELRPIERAFAGINLIGHAGALDRGLQHALDLVPGFIRPDPDSRAGGKLDLEPVEPQVFVHARQQPDEAFAFRPDLIFGGKDMGVILGKAAHPHQPMH